MADETTVPTIDLTKAAAGAWSLDELQGMPVDTFKDRLYARAGILQSDPLRANLVCTHPNDAAANVARIPADFDHGNYSGPLVYVQDWLTLLGTLGTAPQPRTEPTALPGAVAVNSIFEAQSQQASDAAPQEHQE